MEDKIKVGDTVKLKSGGPVMTVVNIDKVSGVFCGYFNVNQEYKQVLLATVDTLQKAVSR